MKRLIVIAAFIATLLAAGTVFAVERTVTLKIDKLTACPTCPYIIKKSVGEVSGVKGVEVSLEDKTAVVTFDDAKTDVEAITAATAKVGFPSTVIEQE